MCVVEKDKEDTEHRKRMVKINITKSGFFFRERKAIYALRGEGSIIEILLLLLNVSSLSKSIKYIPNNVMSQSIFQ